LHSDRRTDMNLIAAFRSFANAPKKPLIDGRLCYIKVFSFADVKNSLDVRPNVLVTLCV